MKSKMTCLKEDCFLCKNVSSEWLEMVRLMREIHSYKKGEQIFREGDALKGVYFILEGKVKVVMSWDRGKEYIVRLAGEGQMMGHRGFGLNNIYPVSATVLENVKACFIDVELFWKLNRTNYPLQHELTLLYANELKSTEQRLKHLVCAPVKWRVAESLLMIREAFGADKNGLLNYSMSRKDLASLAGTTYETVIRMLNELQADGLISFSGKAITLIKPTELVEKSNFNKY